MKHRLKTKLAVLLLASVIAPLAHPATLQEQAICAAEAERSFKNDGYKKEDPANWAVFVSHYDQANQICFVGIEIHRVAGTVLWTFRFVNDAIGGQSYASYSWHTVEGKKYWEVAPFECHITAISGERINYKDDDEFDQLTRKNFGVFFK